MLDYLKALPAIIEKIPHFKAFLIVPKGETSTVGMIQSTISNDEIGRLIGSLGISDQIVWIDSVPYTELKTYILMADVVVLPTMAEGFGLAIAEVCALGVPLVTTTVGAVPEVVGGAAVQLVNPADPEDIARGVVSVRHQETKSLPVKQFVWEECVEKFISVYQHV